MKNKLLVITIITLSLSILLSAGLVNAATDLTTCSPQISLVSQDPITATPGTYVKVVFEVSNLDYCSSGLAVKLNPKYPFSLDSGVDSVRTLASKPYVVGYKTTWDIAYTVRIADDASGENYTLQLLYHSGIGTDFTSSFVEQGFTINILDAQTNFDAVIQETSGSAVSIALANIGKYTANSVIVKIPQQDNFRASGTNGQMVGNLASGDYTIVGFDLVSTKSFSNMQGPANSQASNSQNQSSTSASNELTVEIDYTDNIGVRRTANMQLQMPLSFSGNSTIGGFSGRMQRSSWSVWYTVLIIFGVLVILFILYKKFPEPAKKVFSRIFKRKKKEHYSPSENEAPDWIKKEKEKERKK